MCGATLEAGVEICRSCGEQIARRPQKNKPVPTRIAGWLFLVVAAMFLGITGMDALRSGARRKPTVPPIATPICIVAGITLLFVDRLGKKRK
jgi:hypothetical protein